MKFLSQTEALRRLKNIKETHRRRIQTGYEPKAKNCLTCEVQGSCCTDAHFVNVHITRLEAVAIRESLRQLGSERQREIYARVEETVKKYRLENAAEKFACPLFEKGVGCLIHKSGKPVACIQHACYENLADLPPDELQFESEHSIERLNSKVYGKNWAWLPLPLWLQKLNPFADS